MKSFFVTRDKKQKEAKVENSVKISKLDEETIALIDDKINQSYASIQSMFESKLELFVKNYSTTILEQVNQEVTKLLSIPSDTKLESDKKV